MSLWLLRKSIPDAMALGCTSKVTPSVVWAIKASRKGLTTSDWNDNGPSVERHPSTIWAATPGSTSRDKSDTQSRASSKAHRASSASRPNNGAMSSNPLRALCMGER